MANSFFSSQSTLEIEKTNQDLTDNIKLDLEQDTEISVLKAKVLILENQELNNRITNLENYIKILSEAIYIEKDNQQIIFN